jgi:hypothetical protein
MIIRGITGDRQVDDVYALVDDMRNRTHLPGIREAAKYLCNEIDFLRGHSVIFTVKDTMILLRAIAYTRIEHLEKRANAEGVSIHDTINFNQSRSAYYIQKLTFYNDFLKSNSEECPTKSNPTDVLMAIMHRAWDEHPESFQAFCLGIVASYISTMEVCYRIAKPGITLNDIREYCITRIHLIDSSNALDAGRKTEAMNAFIFVLGTFHK